jgi:hypothetical protein
VSKDLIRRFELKMYNIYRRARSEAGYNATRYLQMLDDHGGLETVKILINSPKVSEGYTALWERGRLDITVETLINDNPKYHELFSKDELKIVRKRLADYQYQPATDSR